MPMTFSNPPTAPSSGAESSPTRTTRSGGFSNVICWPQLTTVIGKPPPGLAPVLLPLPPQAVRSGIPATARTPKPLGLLCMVEPWRLGARLLSSSMMQLQRVGVLVQVTRQPDAPSRRRSDAGGEGGNGGLHTSPSAEPPAPNHPQCDVDAAPCGPAGGIIRVTRPRLDLHRRLSGQECWIGVDTSRIATSMQLLFNQVIYRPGATVRVRFALGFA